MRSFDGIGRSSGGRFGFRGYWRYTCGDTALVHPGAIPDSCVFRTFFLEHNSDGSGQGRYHHPGTDLVFHSGFLLAVMPWTTYVVAAILDVIRDWSFRRKNQQELGDGLKLFLIIWICPGSVLLILAIEVAGIHSACGSAGSDSRGRYLHRRMEERDRPNYVLLGIHAALSAILVAVLLVAPAQLLKLPPTPQALMMASAIGIAIFFGIMLAVVARGGAIRACHADPCHPWRYIHPEDGGAGH